MRKNRGYKRGGRFRDARLFVLICEGAKREPEYFRELGRWLNRKSLRIIALGPPDEQRFQSSPNWLLSRAETYVRTQQFREGDQLWFVFDTDRWNIQHLREILRRCKQRPDWNAAISNPCFEVWLTQHFTDIPDGDVSCTDLKRRLHELHLGGYAASRYVPHVADAIERAANADADSTGEFPEVGCSRAYLLGRALLG